MTLERLLNFCESLVSGGFEFIIIGGWALDICHGTMSREHGDLDMCIWQHDRERFELFLEGTCNCLRIERFMVRDGTSKTIFYFPDGSYGEAMGMRRFGADLVLEGRVWHVQAPQSLLGPPFGTRPLKGVALPIGSLELTTKMQMAWEWI